MIVVVDYEAGNIASVLNMIRKAGGEAKLSGDPAEVETAKRLVLPGVGAFDHGMAMLREKGLVEPIIAAANSGIPLMGICLGMQLLGESSEEGQTAGLGLLPATFRRFRFDKESKLRIPHVGWNTVRIEQDNPMLDESEGKNRFYFVHSFHAECADSDIVLATCDYGYEFPAAIGRENIFGFQFHAEKSHRFGLQLFRRFLELG